MPTRILGTFDLPKVREAIMAVGEKSVCGFLEFELIKLAERINVSGNLTPGQTEFIAGQLIREFPNETLADFKLCFERGAFGKYGRIFKLDGIELGVWMRGIRDADGKIKQLGYLDEKYELMQDEMMKEKDNQWERAKTNTDWLKLWQESIQKTDEEGGVKNTSRNLFMIANARKREIGKPNPDPIEPYPSTPASYQEKIDAAVRKGRELHFREKYPGATDEQIQAFLNSFEDEK